MCYGRCAKYIGYILLVLAVLCIVTNVLLYFPNGERSHVHLNTYVGCLHGIIGGGILVMIPACVFIGLEHQHFHDCCPRENHRRNCALLASVCLACIGLLGAGYCFIISALGIANEPHCFPVDDKTGCHHSLDSARGQMCKCELNQEYNSGATTGQSKELQFILGGATMQQILCITFGMCVVKIKGHYYEFEKEKINSNTVD
uniref:Transmembrane 4 L6 family member 1-like n=1 Tax=Pogona vitticeps TaxID=103695 RepID=A0ABM5FVE4_9SAUR